jgi:hypothetical protein
MHLAQNLHSKEENQFKSRYMPLDFFPFKGFDKPFPFGHNEPPKL